MLHMFLLADSHLTRSFSDTVIHIAITRDEDAMLKVNFGVHFTSAWPADASARLRAYLVDVSDCEWIRGTKTDIPYVLHCVCACVCILASLSMSLIAKRVQVSAAFNRCIRRWSAIGSTRSSDLFSARLAIVLFEENILDWTYEMRPAFSHQRFDIQQTSVSNSLALVRFYNLLQF